MSDTIAWGILGNATIARSCIIPAIQKSRNGIVWALATRFPARATSLTSQYNIEHTYQNYHDLLDDPIIEAVYNPLPNHLHYPWTIKSLRKGKHVLCEKPIACNAGEAREMVETAEKEGVVLMEAFAYRFHPRSQRVREIIEEGIIGKPYMIRSSFCFHMDDALMKSRNNARLRPETGGGSLLDVGCYSVSMARWMLQAEPEMVQAQAIYHESGVDQHFVGLLRFPDDVFSTVEASFVTALQQTYSIVGTKGAIELPHDAFIPWEKDTTFSIRGRDEERGREHCTPGADGYRLMVEHFADVILGKTIARYQPRDSIHTMQVLDALSIAARTGKSVRVP